jgi:two-component system, sensor histidine kinase YesM
VLYHCGRGIPNYMSLLHNLTSRFSILNRLLGAFIFIIILPLSISFIVSQAEIERTMIERVYTAAESSFQLVHRNIDELLERMSSAALFIDGSGELKQIVRDPPTSSRDRFLQASYIEALFDGIENTVIRKDSFLTLLTSDKRLYTNYYQHHDLPDEIQEVLEWRPDVYENLRLHWLGSTSIMDLYDSEEKFTFTVLKQITLDPAAERTAFLLISLPRRVLEHEMRVSSPSIYLLLDNNEHIVGASPGAFADSAYNTPLPLAPVEEGVHRGVLYGGKKHFVFRSSLNIGIWDLVYLIPMDYVVGEIRIVRRRLLLINLLFITIFIIVAFWISRSITRPIADLSAEMKNVEHFFKEDRPHRGNRRDEIGMLENTFHEMKSDLGELMRENSRKEALKREAELEALQAQISPHFLFNTLNTIRWAAFNDNKEKVSQVVRSLGQLLRMTITHKEPLITLREELELVEHYLSIIRSRLAAEFKVEFDIKEPLLDTPIPKLLLQPLAENAVIHGFKNCISESKLTIRGELQGDTVLIHVIDNGEGFDPAQAREESDKEIRFSSIGIENISERIRLFFGEEYGLEIESTPGEGTRVVLRLPRFYPTGESM